MESGFGNRNRVRGWYVTARYLNRQGRHAEVLPLVEHADRLVEGHEYDPLSLFRQIPRRTNNIAVLILALPDSVTGFTGYE